MTSELEYLERQLRDLIQNQEWAAMGDDFYYSNGRKAADDREINLVRQRIEALKKAASV